MKIGQPDYPKLDAPINVEFDGWHAVWHGGEYINIYPTSEGAQLDVEGLNTTDFPAVHSLNTSGNELDPDDPEQYVMGELREWADEQGAVYRANGWG